MSGRGREALEAAGWRPGRDEGQRALLSMLETMSVVALDGASAWQPFPAAERALREFHGLTVAPAGAGIDVAPTGCVVDPAPGCHAVRAFAGLAEELGSRLFPFGRTEADALLAVDEKGRLFAVDHSGRWLLGESVAEGLVSLAEGRAPRRVEPCSQEWEPPRAATEDVVSDLVRTALVLAYVLHRHGLLTTRAVGARVVGFRGHGTVHMEREFRLCHRTLEDNAEPLVDAMEQALGPVALETAEVRLDLLPATPKAPWPPAVGCSLAAGGQSVRGILVRLTARAAAVLEADRHRALLDAAAEVDRYVSAR